MIGLVEGIQRRDGKIALRVVHGVVGLESRQRVHRQREFAAGLSMLPEQYRTLCGDYVTAWYSEGEVEQVTCDACVAELIKRAGER
jgi:hypothetical protein